MFLISTIKESGAFTRYCLIYLKKTLSMLKKNTLSFTWNVSEQLQLLCTSAINLSLFIGTEAFVLWLIGATCLFFSTVFVKRKQIFL